MNDKPIAPPPYVSSETGGPSIIAPSSQTVIITRTNYRNMSVKTTCPNCNTEILSSVDAGHYKWFSYFILLFVMCFFGLCFFFMYKFIKNMPNH